MTIPYVLVDGTQVAKNYADLTDGILDAPISVDEYGNDVSIVSPEYAWTNAYITGTSLNSPHYDSCGEWLSDASVGRVGNINKADNEWTLALVTSTSTTVDCSVMLRLYCFEQ